MAKVAVNDRCDASASWFARFPGSIVMKRSRTGTALLAGATMAVAAPVASAQRVEAPTRLAVVGVTLVDGTGAPPRPGTTILVSNGRITAIGPTDRVAIPAGTTRINGAGRFVIPGLWDMHVHITARAATRFSNGRPDYMAAADYYFPYFLASGVTGIRDMSGQLADLNEMRRRVAAGQLDGPRMLVTGHKIGDREPVIPHGPKGYPDEASVRKAIQLLRENRADFVRLEELRPDLYPALFAAARQAQLPVVGHVPPNLGLVRASDMGIKSVEHLMDVLVTTSSDSGALREEMLDGITLWDRVLIRLHKRQQWEVFRRQIVHATSTQDDAGSAALMQTSVSNGTWMVPTLVANRDVMRLRPDTGIARVSSRLLPMELRMETRSWWRNDKALANVQFSRQMQLVGQMQRSGVKLLAGTDAPGTARLPGESLIEELELMVQAGLTPAQALATATRSPAEFAGTADSLGTLVPGKLADFVLLDANPLDRIGNLRQVAGVSVGGRYRSRPELTRAVSMAEGLRVTWDGTYIARLKAREAGQLAKAKGKGGKPTLAGAIQ